MMTSFLRSVFLRNLGQKMLGFVTSCYKSIKQNRHLRGVHQWYWRVIREEFWFQWRLIPILRLRYFFRLRAVRNVYGVRKIRVAFPVSNLAKWKEQSLYDAMLSSGKFEPFIALTPMDIESEKSHSEKCAIIAKNNEFFSKNGMHVEIAYDLQRGTCLSFSVFRPDIVWYTQPWKIDPIQSPYQASKTALTCYTPYFVQNYGGLDLDCGPRFHRHLWRHFTLNEQWAKVFMRYQGLRRAGESVGLGHPMLDIIKKSDGSAKGSRPVVIYAPHWSCDVGERFSTFLKTGRDILQYAKQHAEISWVFKPHPSLKVTLIKHCGWSEADVARYYGEWESLGDSCYDGGYVELFEKSTCMVTDCASFLIEYACTGKPIIHLISSNAAYEPHAIAQKLFMSYYQVHNWEEARNVFEKVVVEGDDYKKNIRHRAVQEMKLLDNNASRNIYDYLDGILTGRTHESR